MKAKLLALLAQLKSSLSSMSLSALLVGVAAGYLAHPLIKLVIDAVVLLVKGISKV